jgi:protein involved in polysaccharide export with SLBB domain
MLAAPLTARYDAHNPSALVVTIAALIAITTTPAQTKQTSTVGPVVSLSAHASDRVGGNGGDGQSVESTVPVPDGWSNTRYRLTASDVLELSFPYVTEFNQTVTVQPDGYVTLRAVGDLRVQGRTLPELVTLLTEAYEPILREPVITVVLKDFEKPFFVAAGEVKSPGKFELRGALTVTEAVAVAGGFTTGAKHSQVILFRRYSSDLVEVKQIDVKKMLASRDLSEDYVLRPGDTLFVPRNVLSRLAPFLPTAGLGFYLNPFSH